MRPDVEMPGVQTCQLDKAASLGRHVLARSRIGLTMPG